MKRSKYIIILFIIGILTLSASHFVRNILLPHIKSEQIYTKKEASLSTLNYIQPSFLPLTQFSLGKTKLSSSQWSDYVDYYTKVTTVLPDLGEAYLLAGYCYFQSQNQTKSLELIYKSAQLNPALFWGFYDLGLSFSKRNRFKEAVQFLNFAVNIPPDMALKAMLNSKIYGDLWIHIPDFNALRVEHLKKGYETASILLALNIKLLQNPNDQHTHDLLESILTPLDLQIF